jgi:phage I-like protein
MIGAITMPVWLVDFWTVYGDMITPVLVTLMLSIVTAIAFKIKSDAKIAAQKAELQLQALKEVANREDNKPQLEAQEAKMAELTSAVANLSSMIDLAFQNSNLDPEIKANLTALSNKIKYGTEEDLLNELESRNAALQAQVESLTQQLASAVTVKTETALTTKRTRR